MPKTGPESQLFQSLAALAEQVWIIKDRQIVLETVMAEQGLDLRDALEHFQPDAQLSQRLDQERKQFINSVMQSFGAEHGNA